MELALNNFVVNKEQESLKSIANAPRRQNYRNFLYVK